LLQYKKDAPYYLKDLQNLLKVAVVTQKYCIIWEALSKWCRNTT